VSTDAEHFAVLGRRLGLSPEAAAQIQASVGVRVVAEIVRAIAGPGGHVRLQPGFEQRIAEGDLAYSLHHDDETNEWVVTVLDTPDSIDTVGVGSRWQRVERHSDQQQRMTVYEVVDPLDGDAEHVLMQRINDDNGQRYGMPVAVKLERLRAGAAGWERWRPPPDVVAGSMDGAA
jgi:hypothetical protein